MKSIIIFLLFVGMFMIVTGVYEEKLNQIKNEKQIEYKFIPRTYYEDQLGNDDSIFKWTVENPVFHSPNLAGYDPGSNVMSKIKT